MGMLDAVPKGAVNGPEGDILDWDAIDWRAVEDDVRRAAATDLHGIAGRGT
jgi:RNA-directed DNA polymerase